MASSQKFQLDPPFSTGKYMKVYAHQQVTRVRNSAGGIGLKTALVIHVSSKQRLKFYIGGNNCHLIRNQALRTLAWKLQK